jgi:putative sterol carrier protein
MNAGTWLALVNQEMSGMQAFMGGKLKATGDIMLAQKIPAIFPL